MCLINKLFFFPLYACGPLGQLLFTTKRNQINKSVNFFAFLLNDLRSVIAYSSVLLGLIGPFLRGNQCPVRTPDQVELLLVLQRPDGLADGLEALERLRLGERPRWIDIRMAPLHEFAGVPASRMLFPTGVASRLPGFTRVFFVRVAVTPGVR